LVRSDVPIFETKSLPAVNESYLTVAILFVAAVGFALAPIILAWLWAKKFSPQKPGQEKNATYECGLESKGDAWVQFKSEYYLYAIIFLIFDVETIFLLPFAVAFTSLPAGAFVAMMVFILLLVEGLVWAWKKGVLTWQ
jgi:NADH-quinone oxidoreductase subunit A